MVSQSELGIVDVYFVLSLMIWWIPANFIIGFMTCVLVLIAQFTVVFHYNCGFLASELQYYILSIKPFSITGNAAIVRAYTVWITWHGHYSVNLFLLEPFITYSWALMTIHAMSMLCLRQQFLLDLPNSYMVFPSSSAIFVSANYAKSTALFTCVQAYCTIQLQLFSLLL